jgi:phosphatidate cytidylyltransferase
LAAFHLIVRIEGVTVLLRWRLISAFVIITLAVAVVALDYHTPAFSGLFLIPLGMVFVVLAADEMRALVVMKTTRAQRWLLNTLAALSFVFVSFPILYEAIKGPYPADCSISRVGWLGLSLLASSVLLLLHEAFWYRGEDPTRIERITKSIFILVYPTSFLGMAVVLRQVGYMFHTASDAGPHGFGLAILVSVILIPKLSDTGAFFGGRKWGKRKLARFLSPNKSLEGAAFGLAAGSLASWLYFGFIAPTCFQIEAVTIWRSLGYGLALSVAGVAGDLLESLFKRDAGEKDSSRWLPGLGGILDTVDSILLAIPVAYLLCVLNWTGAGGG